MTTCGLCGYRFDPEESQSACAACPLHTKCALLRCPNCGYEFPPAGGKKTPAGSKKGSKQKRTRARRKGRDTHTPHTEQRSTELMSLKEFPLGRTGVIADIDTRDSELLNKLLTIGALPQTEVELLQKRPTFVIRMGYSTFAVDEELASCITVQSA